MLDRLKPPAQKRNILKQGTDWAYLETATDEDIQRGIDHDPNSAPALSREEIRARYKPASPRVRH